MFGFSDSAATSLRRYGTSVGVDFYEEGLSTIFGRVSFWQAEGRIFAEDRPLSVAKTLKTKQVYDRILVVAFSTQESRLFNLTSNISPSLEFS